MIAKILIIQRKSELCFISLPVFLSHIFHWNIVYLQCCASFQCTAKWFSYKGSYKYTLFNVFCSIISYYNILSTVPCTVHPPLIFEYFALPFRCFSMLFSIYKGLLCVMNGNNAKWGSFTCSGAKRPSMSSWASGLGGIRNYSYWGRDACGCVDLALRAEVKSRMCLTRRKGEATENGQRWCCCHKPKGAKCLVNQLGKKLVVPEECCWFLLSNYQLHILTLWNAPCSQRGRPR